MARNRRGRGKRRDSNYDTLMVHQNLSFGSLGNEVAVIDGMLDAAIEQNFMLIRADLMWAVRNAVAGQGPFQFGITGSYYSTAEIAEFLKSDKFRQGDPQTREVSDRRVRQVGWFPGVATEEVWNGGRMSRTRLNWIFARAQQPSFYLYNQGGATTTGSPVLEVMGTLHIRWR